jgi:drug/metabolite transporter (DMT)-like permease
VAPPARAQDNVRASIVLIIAILAFSVETMVVRALSSSSTPAQAVVFRAGAQLVVVAVWIVWRRRGFSLATRHLGLHLARGFVSVVGWWLYYRMFQKLDYALATLLTFASSLFVVMLARPVLGERVQLVSWIATVMGFAGIFIATGADVGGLDIEVALGLLAAAFSAMIVFLTRKLVLAEDTVTIMTYIGLIVFAVSAPVAAATWQPLALGHAVQLSLASLLGALGMILMIEAYGMGEAAVLAPIGYLRMAFALALGYLFFAEVPGPRILIGTAIVVASALYAMHHEHRRKQRLIGSGSIGSGPAR